MSDHWSNCWLLESHPACRLHRILELEKALALRATPTFSGYHPPPCHDHIEPPVHIGPTWSAHHDDPPSFTP